MNGKEVASMQKTQNEIMAMAHLCKCGNPHYEVQIDPIVIDYGAIQQAANFVASNYSKAVLIADEHTFQAAGKQLVEALMQHDVQYTVCMIKPNAIGDVIADEASLIQAMLETPNDTDVLLAVGSGTIHDITRFVGYKMAKPFISIPTAPSVDGFTSMGAPLIVRGFKQTFQTQSPIALFADVDVLTRAPQLMIAAGVGDMFAKFTSLADWRFSHLMAGEPYCPVVAKVTAQALGDCVQHIDEIAQKDETGIRILIKSLIDSGLAMLLFGASHPASGGEHHVSHYWEMEFLKLGKNQVLHGAKVGVSVQLLADKYRSFLTETVPALTLTQAENIRLNANEMIEKLIAHRSEIEGLANDIPKAQSIKEMLRKVDGPLEPEDLGVDQHLIQHSMKEAHHIRNRYTMLKFMNEVQN